MSDQSTRRRVLAGSQLLAGCAATTLEILAPHAICREFHDGDEIWREGQLGDAFWVIDRGLISIQRGHADGTGSIIAIFGPGDPIGAPAAIEQSPYPADAVVVSASAHLVALPAQTVLELARAHADLAACLQQALLRHTRALHAKISVLSAGSVPARLATLMLHLLDRFGERAPDGTHVIGITVSRARMAELVSARIETVIRALRPWEEQGLCSTTPRGFVVYDIEALRARALEG